MKALPRRAIFALPLAVPVAGLAAALPAMPKVGEIRAFSIRIDASRFKNWPIVEEVHVIPTWRAPLRRSCWDGEGFIDDRWNVWSAADIARTLGIPYDDPPTFTDADFAATLAIDAPAGEG